MATRLKHLGDLSQLREQLAERARAHERQKQAIATRRQHAERATRDFGRAMDEIGVEPLAPHGRHVAKPEPQPPQPAQRLRDEREVLVSSVSDEIDVDSLLETDESLSYRRTGIGPDTLRKLRRGEWSIQDQLDLHGHRIDEAREALTRFLRDAVRRGLRCVRIVHGKGLGSKDRTPVLKGKVHAWLVQRDEVIAFCQARPAAGGSGALVVLLRPSTSAKAAG